LRARGTRRVHPRGDGNCGNPAPAPRIFNVANKIANDFNLIGVTIRDCNVSELIFDQYQQFQTIKPVGPEIVMEVRFVRDATDVDVEMLATSARISRTSKPSLLIFVESSSSY
jgi:hypothetical protein